MQKSFHFLWFTKKIIDLFVDPALNLNYKGKQNSEFWKDSKSQNDKTQFEGKRYKSDYYQQSFVLSLYEVTSENLRNNEYFEFTSKES